jgi:energy-coupling factor transporter ATP-binding protein EcfA2
VLDGVDLAVPEGTIFSLLGPNGAGKTTAVKILSTLISPDAASGEIRVGELGSGTADLYTAIGKLEVGIPRAPPSGWTRTPRPAGCATTCRPPAPPSSPTGPSRCAPAAEAVTSSSAAPDPDAAPTVPTSLHPARETASALA